MLVNGKVTLTFYKKSPWPDSIQKIKSFPEQREYHGRNGLAMLPFPNLTSPLPIQQGRHLRAWVNVS